jgi:cell division septum initiation protein DivIVA
MQALIALGLFLALACGIQTFRIGVLKEEAAEQRAALATATAAAEKEARTREAEMADAVRKASDVYAKNLARAQAGAAGALSELDSLRNALNATSPAAPASAASGSTHGTGGPERELLGACAATLQGMAAQADRLESKVIGLQDYIRSIGK